ncbi:formylglycine-generating enzyme family protein [Candidatus Nitrospira salsa]
MDGRFKFVFLIAVLFLTSLPLLGILKGTKPPPPDPDDALLASRNTEQASQPQREDVTLIKDHMVKIPAGEFIRGTNNGGFNERPENRVHVDTYWIDKFEITNHQYLEFVESTGHRKPGPPSRYAKNMTNLRGPNQPVTYVSWADAKAYCEWKGKRLPTETEWEKAMRGTDGRTWPWGDELGKDLANLGGAQDGFEFTAPVGSFPQDQSVFGVFDGAGNLMEWTENWYVEQLYAKSVESDSSTVSRTYKTLRGGGYTNRGVDLRITSRMFMVPDFRDETIGFRCVSSSEITGNPKNSTEKI